jgi:hypothetical protein
VWSLIERPKQNVVGIKWVFHNKQNEHGVVTRNKARLIAKGYSQVKGLDFDKTFTLVARLESIRMLLAYTTHHGFKLYQMDVKSAFLNGPIKEDVYVEQSLGFESDKYSNHIYKLHKVLYGIRIDKDDSTLFTRKMGKDLFVCQIYIDDVIFGSTNKLFCDEFSKIMTGRFEMSMMEVLTFFLRFQIKQVKEGTFISQIKYTHDILKNLAWTKQSQSKRPWTLMVILILTWAAHRLIKRYIAQ